MLGKLVHRNSQAAFRLTFSAACAALLLVAVGCGGGGTDTVGGGGGGTQFAGNYVGNVPFTTGRNGDIALAVNSQGALTGTLTVNAIMAGRAEVDFPIPPGVHQLTGTVDSQGNFTATEPNSTVAYNVSGTLTTSGTGMSVGVNVGTNQSFPGSLQKEQTGGGGAFKSDYRGSVILKPSIPSTFEFAVSDSGALTGKISASSFVDGDFPLGPGEYSFSGTVNASGSFTALGSSGPNKTFPVTGKILQGGQNMGITFVLPSGSYSGEFNPFNPGGSKTSSLTFSEISGSNFSNKPWLELDDSDVSVEGGYVRLDVKSTVDGVTRLFTLKFKEGMFENGQTVNTSSEASITLNQYEPNVFLPKAWFTQSGQIRFISTNPETLEVQVTDAVFGSMSGMGGTGTFKMNGFIRH